MASRHLEDLRFNDDRDNIPQGTCPINVSLGAEVGAENAVKAKYTEPCRYWSYIHPDKLTSLQRGREGKGLNHHDEHLFIVVHQAFELWFKQILFEVDWIRDTLLSMVSQGPVPATKPLLLNSHEEETQEFSSNTVLRLLIHRTNRADKILRIATHGFDAMETMEPMDFLDFRDFLIPASGFQSVQLRELEIVVGLQDDHRLKLNGQVYTQQFYTDKEDLTGTLTKRNAEVSLRVALYKCLAHMTIPERDGFAKRFLQQKNSQYEAKIRDMRAKIVDFTEMESKLFQFNQSHSEALYDTVFASGKVEDIEAFLKKFGMDYQIALRVGELGLKICKAARSNDYSYTKAQFHANLLAYHSHDTSMASATLSHLERGVKETSSEYQAVEDFFMSEELIDPRPSSNPSTDSYTLGMMRRAALYLLSHPWTQPGYESFDSSEWSLFMSSVLKFEQAMILWRSRHARMVELMIGRRIGTGGSSGVEYLDKTQLYRVYQDIWRIRALLVPTSALK